MNRIFDMVVFGLLSTAAVGCATQVDGEEGNTDDIATTSGGGGGVNPVIWIPGCPPPFGNAAQGAALVADQQQAYFQANGYTADQLFRFVYSGAQCGSAADQALELAEFVDDVLDETGARKVDLVAHSQGALVARMYILFGGTIFVDDFVSLAGANHGAATAAVWSDWQAQFGGAPAYEGLQEMFPPYACKHETAGGGLDVQYILNGCLTATGRTANRDETPWTTNVLSIRNTIDENVQPRESACLNQKFQNDCSSSVNVAVTVPPGPGPCGPAGCPGHLRMVWEPAVMQQTLDFVH